MFSSECTTSQLIVWMKEIAFLLAKKMAVKSVASKSGAGAKIGAIAVCFVADVSRPSRSCCVRE